MMQDYTAEKLSSKRELSISIYWQIVHEVKYNSLGDRDFLGFAEFKSILHQRGMCQLTDQMSFSAANARNRKNIVYLQ